MKVLGIILALVALQNFALAADPAPTPVPSPAPVSKLEGHWSQYCQNGALREEVFQGANVSLLEKKFSDPACTNLEVVTASAGTFESDTEFHEPDQSTFNMDFTFAAVKITLLSDRYVIYFIDHQMCGLKDWKKGEVREISGMQCAFVQGGLPIPVPKKGDMRYGIYKIDTNGRLYFGHLMHGYDGTSPQRRPYLLDARYFVKLAQAPLL